MQPVIIENSSAAEATGLEPLYRSCGATEMVNVRCEPWNPRKPIDCASDVFAAASRLRPGEPLCVKYTWLGNRSMDAVNASQVTDFRPPVGPIIDGYRRGMCNPDQRDENGVSDLSTLTPLGNEYDRRGRFPDIVHVNNECGNGYWCFTPEPDYGPSPSPNQLASLENVRTANARNKAILLAVMMDDACRAQLSPALRAIPKDEQAILESVNQFGAFKEGFEIRQRDWGTRWTKIKLATIRATHVRSRAIGPRTSVYVSFSGPWKHWMCDLNGHEVAPSIMPAQFYANWQVYGDRPLDTLTAAAMAQAPNARLTFTAENEPGRIAELLRVAAPNGAFLYCPGGVDQAMRHADVISSYTGLR